MTTHCIIVTYNGIEWIKKCLDSLQESSVILKVICIDNGSTDGTQNIIKSYSSVKFIQSETNLGFGKANNIGINIALENSADYVFLLNQDAWIEKDTLKNLLEVITENENIEIASPIHLNGSGKALDKLFATYVAPKLSNDPCLFMSDAYTHQLAKYYEVDFVNAAAWLLSRECIEKVGLFDPLFYHYGEDVNYCQRLSYFKYKLAIVSGSKIYHDREDRVIKKDKSIHFKERTLLIELADPRSSDSYFKNRISYLKKYYFRDFILNVLRSRFSKAKEALYFRRFLIINRSKIVLSRNRNKC